MYSCRCEGFSFRKQRIVVAALFILVLVSGAVPAASALTNLKQPVPVNPAVLDNVGTMSPCQAPCACMLSNDADLKWGAGNYVTCSNTPCELVSMAGGELRVPKFCYRQKQQAVIVTTTTPVPEYQPPVAVQLQDPMKVQTTVAIVQPVSVIPVQPVNAVNKSLDDNRLVTLDPSQFSKTTLPTSAATPAPTKEVPAGNMLVSIFGKVPFLGSLLCGGKDACGSTCVDLKSDDQNCGTCGNVCFPPEKCYKGSCERFCPEGMTDCGGDCVDLQTSDLNCGSCGKFCSPGFSCAAGMCVPQPKGGSFDMPVTIKLTPEIKQEQYVTTPGINFRLLSGAYCEDWGNTEINMGDIVPNPIGWVVGTNSNICVIDKYPYLLSTDPGQCANDDSGCSSIRYDNDADQPSTWVTLDYRVRMKIDTARFNKNPVKKATLKMKAVETHFGWGVPSPKQSISTVWYKKADYFPPSFPDSFDNFDKLVGVYITDIPTWSDVPSTGGTSGGDFSGSTAKASWDPATATVTIDMTDLVNKWITGDPKNHLENHGFILRDGPGLPGGSARFTYYSFESFEVVT